jgi:LysM repeat protein
METLMNRMPYVIIIALAMLIVSACTLDGGAALPTPTYTLLATFPPPVAPDTPAPAVTAVTEVAQVVITEVEPVVQVGVTQVAVTQVAAVNDIVPTPDPTCTPPAGWQPYIVVAGDTLGVLAISTFTSVADLVTANCIANPDLIYAGQTLYVPRTPGTFLPAPITDGVDVPTIDNMLVEPSMVMNATYTVTPGIVTVRAGAVENAASVTFYMAPIGAESTPVVLGEDTNLTDGATTTWEIGTVPLRANVWAIATDVASRLVTSEPILVQANM